jgi:hypothetical protein
MSLDDWGKEFEQLTTLLIKAEGTNDFLVKFWAHVPL